MKFILLLLAILALGSEGLTQFKFFKNRVRNLRTDLPISEGSEETYQEKWFQQPLDHFYPMETKIWIQRYFEKNQYYKEGGPIFLMVSGEQVAYPQWLDEGASLEVYLAKKFGAKIYLLEHRYYGMSRPTSDLRTENLLYLNADQALADTAYFISGMQAIDSIPESSKWILFGASYAGTLVTWMRSKYPHLVYGAVANSPPLLAQVDFKDFYLVSEMLVKKHSQSCAKTIASAFEKLDQMIKDPTTYRDLEKLFHTCGEYLEAGDKSRNDIIMFFDTIISVVFEVVYNNHRDDLTIEKACEVLENEKNGEPIARLALVNDLLLREQGADCLSLYKYEDIIEELKHSAWTDSEWERRWYYQTCTEFGWYPTTSGRPFGIPNDTVPVRMYKQLCTEAFGSRNVDMPELGVSRTNLMYGGLKIINATNKVISVHGSNDPWHAAGVIHSTNPESPVFYIEGDGHCPLTSPPKPSDSLQKIKAIESIEKIIDEWIHEQ